MRWRKPMTGESRREKVPAAQSLVGLRLRVLYNAQEPLQEYAFPPMVQARSVVEQSFNVHEESVWPVQRYRVRVKPVYICKLQPDVSIP